MRDKQMRFKNPDSSYYGTDFFMLNNTLSNEELLFQLNEMARKGTKSILARTYSGLNSDYPGENFKKKTRFIIDNAKKLGITVYLQAKYMPECIPNIPSEYAISHIVPTKTNEVLPGDNVICTHNDMSFCVCLSDSIVDLFDKNSVDYYIKDCYENMWSDFEEFYGNTVLSVWVDEPAFGRAFPPCPKSFFDIFKNEYGYDFAPNVFKLWYAEDNYKTVRFHYWTLIQKLMENNYFKRLKAWCKTKNLKFSGHLLGEDCLKNQIRHSSAVMPFYKYFDIPGIDILTINANWNDSPIKSKHGDELRDSQRLYTTPIQVLSAANQSGNGEHILCEMYGASTENMTFRNQMYLFDRLAVFGINHRSVHGIFYSLEGRRKRGYAPHINYYQPYWDKYDNVYMHCARTAQFTRFGSPCADVLVLHPLETAYTILNEKLPDRIDDTEIDRFDSWFYRLMSNLKSAHIDFELGDFATVRDMGEITDEGFFKVGKMNYKTVVLPRIDVLSKCVFELLKKFSEIGGKIICIGKKPSMLDGYAHDFSNEINFEIVDISNYVSVISKCGSDYKIIGTDSAAHIAIHRRRDEKCDYFMLMNTDCSHKKDFLLAVRGERCVKLWNSENGEATEVYADFNGENTVYKGSVNEGGSVLLSFEKGRRSVQKCDILKCSFVPLDGGFSVKRENKNTFLLEYCRYKTENSDFSCEMPVLAVNELLYAEDKRQKIEICFDFVSDAEIDGLSLALEDMENSEIYFNGAHIERKITGYHIDKSFKTVDLPRCKIGKNTITVKKEYIPLTKTSKSLASIFENSSGTELECMYLVGDFAVLSQSENTLNGCLRLNRNFVISKEKDYADFCDLTTEGYPFYTGAVNMFKKFNVNTDDVKDAFLHLRCLNAAAAEVYVNGEFIGDINRAPAKLSCKNALKNGENTVTFKLYTTLRNVFGPSHRMIGERGNTFGDTPSRKRGCYGYFDEPWIPMDISVSDWQNNIDTDTDTWTSSYNLLPLGFNGAEIVLCY